MFSLRGIDISAHWSKFINLEIDWVWSNKMFHEKLWWINQYSMLGWRKPGMHRAEWKVLRTALPQRTGPCQRAENAEMTWAVWFRATCWLFLSSAIVEPLMGRFARFSTAYGSESSNLPKQKHQDMVYSVKTFCSLCCYVGFLWLVSFV